MRFRCCAGMSPVDEGGARWYLVQSRPRQEKRAELNLRNQNYRTYAPSWCVERVYRSKRVERTEALFPGYLFVQLRRLVDDFRPIASTRGVLRLVSFGEEPLPVDETVIELIRRRVGDNKVRAAFETGEGVEILEGPYRGLEAIFHSFDGRERGVLLLSFMQQQVKASLPLADIRRA